MYPFKVPKIIQVISNGEQIETGGIWVTSDWSCSPESLFRHSSIWLCMCSSYFVLVVMLADYWTGLQFLNLFISYCVVPENILTSPTEPTLNPFGNSTLAPYFSLKTFDFIPTPWSFPCPSRGGMDIFTVILNGTEFWTTVWRNRSLGSGWQM